MENNRLNQKVSDIKEDHSFLNEIINFARNFLLSDLIGKNLEGNLALNRPIAFHQTITAIGGNLLFVANPLSIIIHIARFIECSRTTAREI